MLYWPTWTMVSRFCRDVDTVLMTEAGPMVTTVTWCGWGVWAGAGTMTVAWWVGAGGLVGANAWQNSKRQIQCWCVCFGNRRHVPVGGKIHVRPNKQTNKLGEKMFHSVQPSHSLNNTSNQGAACGEVHTPIDLASCGRLLEQETAAVEGDQLAGHRLAHKSVTAADSSESAR